MNGSNVSSFEKFSKKNVKNKKSKRHHDECSLRQKRRQKRDQHYA